MGEDFIAHSFKVAASVDPDVKLYYNDFNIERYINDKIRAVHALVSKAQAAGARIDGIGMQDHARVGNAQSMKELTDTMEFFGEVVDELAFTEVDIRHTRLPIGDAEREQQAKDYVEMVRACLAVEKCVGITVWDFSDQVRFLPLRFLVCAPRSLELAWLNYVSTRGFRTSIRARARPACLTATSRKSQRITAC